MIVRRGTQGIVKVCLFEEITNCIVIKIIVGCQIKIKLTVDNESLKVVVNGTRLMKIQGLVAITLLIDDPIDGNIEDGEEEDKSKSGQSVQRV